MRAHMINLAQKNVDTAGVDAGPFLSHLGDGHSP